MLQRIRSSAAIGKSKSRTNADAMMKPSMFAFVLLVAAPAAALRILPSSPLGGDAPKLGSSASSSASNSAGNAAQPRMKFAASKKFAVRRVPKPSQHPLASGELLSRLGVEGVCAADDDALFSAFFEDYQP